MYKYLCDKCGDKIENIIVPTEISADHIKKWSLGDPSSFKIEIEIHNFPDLANARYFIIFALENYLKALKNHTAGHNRSELFDFKGIKMSVVCTDIPKTTQQTD